MKKEYKITLFCAEMNEEDIKAMNGRFYQAMEEAMGIDNGWGLIIEEIKEDK